MSGSVPPGPRAAASGPGVVPVASTAARASSTEAASAAACVVLREGTDPIMSSSTRPPLDKPARTRLNGPRVRDPRRDPRRDARAIGRATRSRALAPEEEIWSLLSAIGNAGVVDLPRPRADATGGAHGRLGGAD